MMDVQYLKIMGPDELDQICILIKRRRDPKTVSTSVFKKSRRIQQRNVREERLEGRIQQAPCNNCARIYKSRRGEVILQAEGQSKSFVEEVMIEIDLQGFWLINNWQATVHPSQSLNQVPFKGVCILIGNNMIYTQITQVTFLEYFHVLTIILCSKCMYCYPEVIRLTDLSKGRQTTAL